jgi:hypothetical protein
MCRVCFLVLFFSIFTYKAGAQGDFRRGYVINTKGDSIPGFVDYRTVKKSTTTCFYRVTKLGKTERYSPAELRAFGYWLDKRYETKEVILNGHTESVFMEALVRGQLSLYRYNYKFFIQGEKFEELPEEKIESKENVGGGSGKTFIEVLNSHLVECDLHADGADYTERAITNLIQNFNRCKGQIGITYKPDKKLTQIHINAFSGIDQSALSMDGYVKETFKKSVTSYSGISIDISPTKVSDKLSFTVEAGYVKKVYHGFVQQTVNESTTNRYDLSIDISFVKIPLGLRYNLLHEAATPYFKVGIVNYFPIKDAEMKVLKEQQVKNLVFTEYTTTKPNTKNQKGYWVGVGYSQIVYSRVKAFVELRYEKTDGFLEEHLINSKVTTTNVSVMVGLRF